MRWHHHVHENYFFLHSISVSEYLNPFRSVCIWFFKPSELGFFVVYTKYYIMFILLFSPHPHPHTLPPHPKKWFLKCEVIFFPIFSEMYTCTEIFVIHCSFLTDNNSTQANARNTCAEMSINFLNNEYIPLFNSQVSPY